MASMVDTAGKPDFSGYWVCYKSDNMAEFLKTGLAVPWAFRQLAYASNYGNGKIFHTIEQSDDNTKIKVKVTSPGDNSEREITLDGTPCSLPSKKGEELLDQNSVSAVWHQPDDNSDGMYILSTFTGDQEGLVVNRRMKGQDMVLIMNKNSVACTRWFKRVEKSID